MLMVAVERGDSGPLVVKRASGPAGAEALRREGERLRRAAHPGVVAVVRSGPTADGWELALAHGGRPLSTIGTVPPRAAASITAAVAATVADLHDVGIVHGRIEASHVLLGEQGRPILCGFGPGSDDRGPADDVAAIGHLLDVLLGPPGPPELVPDRRWRSRLLGSDSERRALLAVADLAVADPAERRPTARRLASALADAVPTPATVSAAPAHRPDGTEPIEHVRPAHAAPRSSPRRGLVAALGVAGIAAVAVLLLGIAGLLAGPPDAVASAPRAPEIAETSATVPGSMLTVDGRRYRVGEPGDHLLVGDWWCRDEPTPAVLRPSTTEVFVFDRWAIDEPLAVRPAATVPGATTLVSLRGDDGCPVLAAALDRGELVGIDLDRAP